MNEQWVEIRKSGNYTELGKALGVSPITARIMRNRELIDIKSMEDFLSPEGMPFHSPNLLYGINILIKYLSEKVTEGKKIRIIGDYDVDGICSTYILYKGLTYLGADCDYTIPHRIEDGYGINIRLIDNAYKAGVDTILTCDNGIAAREQTEYANSLGMTMLITDHHEVPFEEDGNDRHFLWPNADAIVDPKLPQDEYPFKGICGAFVAYKVIVALGEAMGKTGETRYQTLMDEFTEFAALATVCDVMELTDENRSLVKKGLKLMRDSGNPGLKALIEVNGIQDRVLTPYHAGFIIGPCLNASGRLDTSMKAMELFTMEDPSGIAPLALELKTLNESRKQMTIEETGKAIEMVEAMKAFDKVIVLLLPDCHESLAGIIAGRVREKFLRPTFVLTRTENGLKGSGRSIDSYNMFEELQKAGDLLTKFGGHKLAAGISLDEENLEAFRKRLNDNCALDEKDFCDTVRIDMELPLGYADTNLAHELERLEPFGTGNETPTFARLGVTFLSGRIMGKNANVAKYKVSDGDGRVYELIYFGDFKALEDFVGEQYGEEKKNLFHSGLNVNVKLDICYRLSINTYMGRESAQLSLKCYR